jgi:hypothetical protein
VESEEVNSGLTANSLDSSVIGGAFIESLKRNNKQIKDSRAASIAEDLEFAYRNLIEQLKRDKRSKERALEDKLDLSPTNTQSLVLAADFDAVKFASEDISIGIDIRNLDIKLDIARKRYKFLFDKNI